MILVVSHHAICWAAPWRHIKGFLWSVRHRLSWAAVVGWNMAHYHGGWSIWEDWVGRARLTPLYFPSPQLHSPLCFVETTLVSVQPVMWWLPREVIKAEKWVWDLDLFGFTVFIPVLSSFRGMAGNPNLERTESEPKVPVRSHISQLLEQNHLL